MLNHSSDILDTTVRVNVLSNAELTYTHTRTTHTLPNQGGTVGTRSNITQYRRISAHTFIFFLTSTLSN